MADLSRAAARLSDACAGQGPAVEAAEHRVGDRLVRSRWWGTRRAGHPTLVVVPGLGALGYLTPALEACGGWTAAGLLDLPGYGSVDTARSPSTLAAVASAVAGWLRVAAPGPVLLLGHSTGAQAALRAALAVPERVAGLVLAGPTFPPQARTWGALAIRVARTARHERFAEVPAVWPEYVRSHGRFLSLLRSGMADRPEDAVTGVTCPLLVLRGEHDAVSPGEWAQRLAGSGGRCLTLPGAHNFPFTHPDATSEAVRGLLR